MIDYGPFLFAAPPRTGSTWFMKACYLSGLGEGFKSHVHFPPEEPQSKLVVSLVRHPCSWLASYYTAIKGGHCGVEVVDELCLLDFSTFEEFLESYLQTLPGILFRIVKAYRADTYLRTEDFPWNFYDLVEGCGLTSKDCRVSLLLNAQNQSKHPRFVPDHLQKRIKEAESELCELFDYY